MSESGPTSPMPAGPDGHSRGPLIMGVTWALTGVCIFIVAARFHVRTKVNGKPSSDDWFMLAALAVQLVFQGFITRAFQYGLGKQDLDIELPDLMMIMKWNYASTTPAVLVSILARISANILLTRLFSNKRLLKWYLWSFTAFQALCSILLIAFVWAQVKPIEGLWNPLLPARRWDPRIQLYMSYLTQSAFTFSDLTYVLFPVMYIWNLHMPNRQKVGLAILMALSFITAAASIMKTVETPRADAGEKPNAQYNASIAVLWSGVEQTLVIILSCIAPLRATFISLMRTHFGRFGTGLVGFVTGSSRSHGQSKGTAASKNGSTARDSRHPQSMQQWSGSTPAARGLHSNNRYNVDVEVEPRTSSVHHLRQESLTGSVSSSSNENLHPTDSDLEMGHGHIRRTDHVSVTYASNDSPRGGEAQVAHPSTNV